MLSGGSLFILALFAINLDFFRFVPWECQTGFLVFLVAQACRVNVRGKHSWSTPGLLLDFLNLLLIFWVLPVEGIVFKILSHLVSLCPRFRQVSDFDEVLTLNDITVVEALSFEELHSKIDTVGGLGRRCRIVFDLAHSVLSECGLFGRNGFLRSDLPLGVRW